MAIEEFKKTNRIQGVDFSKRLKKLVEVYNERKDFQSLQRDVLDDVADQFAGFFEELLSARNSFKGMGIDFEEKAFYDIKAELRVDRIMLPDEHGYPPVPKDEVYKEIFEQTENFKRFRDE